MESEHSVGGQMSKVHRILLAIVSLIIANVVSFFTLTHNLSAGVYPVDADSIGLPLMEGWILSVVVLVLLASAIYVPKGIWLGVVASVAMCGVAGFISAETTVSWTIPHHYGMAIAYAGVSAVCIGLAASYIHKLWTKKSN